MSSRYFSQSFSISCIWCLMICNSIRPCFGVVFPRSDSSVESYSNSNDIGTGSSSSSEGNIRFDTTDSLNEEAREHSDDDDARTKGWNYLDSKKRKLDKYIPCHYLNGSFKLCPIRMKLFFV